MAISELRYAEPLGGLHAWVARLARTPAALIASMSVLAACRQRDPQSEQTAVPPVLVTAPESSCSDIARTVAKWQGREVEACGSARQQFRTLTAFGNGYLFEWVPGSGEAELWKLQADDSFGSEPQAVHMFPGTFRDNRLLVALGERLFNYHQENGQVQLHAMDFAARGWADPRPLELATESWGKPPLGGRSFVALDAQHLISSYPSTGSYDVVRYVEGEVFERFSGFEPKDTLRRGHRWVALGQNRLLEWNPRTHAYQIWSYDVSRLPSDIFDGEPAAIGEWPELGYQHELLVVAPGKLGIWDRDLGTVEVRHYEPQAADPLAGEISNVTHDDRFRSLRSGFETQTTSNVRRLLVVFQQGRSFDSYFGRYCRAPAGTNPACTEGPDCCEAIPELVEQTPCQELDIADTYAPNETPRCLAQKRVAWSSDRLVVSSECGDVRDFACTDAGDSASPAAPYHALAREGTLLDRYFASVADSSIENLYYFGLTQSFVGYLTGAAGVSIGDILAQANIPFALYVSDSDSTLGFKPPVHDDGSWANFRSLGELSYDISTEQLGPISVVIPDSDALECEAPGEPASLVTGIDFTTGVARWIAASARYAPETLVVITHFAAGGFYDHVPPPPRPAQDEDPAYRPYGSRVPFLALGPFVRRNWVSHEELEHSSLTAFIEWNWFGSSGRLLGRDAYIANLNVVLDPATLGVPIE